MSATSYLSIEPVFNDVNNKSTAVTKYRLIRSIGDIREVLFEGSYEECSNAWETFNISSQISYSSGLNSGTMNVTDTGTGFMYKSTLKTASSKMSIKEFIWSKAFPDREEIDWDYFYDWISENAPTAIEIALEYRGYENVYLVIPKLSDEPLVYRNIRDAEERLADLGNGSTQEYRVVKEIVR